MSKTLKERSEEMLARITSDYDDHFARLEDPEATEELCRPSPDMPVGKWYHFGFIKLDGKTNWAWTENTAKEYGLTYGSTSGYVYDGDTEFYFQGSHISVAYPKLLAEARVIYKGYPDSPIAVHTNNFWTIRSINGSSRPDVVRQQIALPSLSSAAIGNEFHVYLYVIDDLEVTS